MKNQILVTEPDMRRLERLAENRLPSMADSIEALEKELERAAVVDPETISERVVTMNSRVRIHYLDRDTETVVTLVYPSEANAEQRKISVLAPLGTALLGARVSQNVKFEAPGGRRRVKILAIDYQPEAASRSRVVEPAVVLNSGTSG